VVLVVDSMDAGLPEAACPGTDPFLVSGFSPQGGTWSGPFIQPNGLFDPSTVGSYELTYAAGNCSDTKLINVDELVGPASPLDTVCQSEVPFVIPISPFGGRWSGVGIVDTLYGVFDPDEAGGGTHQLTYTMHGCEETYAIHVKPIDIGNDRSACPSQAPYALTPAAIPPGGTWYGNGIVDALAGVYDPMQVFSGNAVWDQVTYQALNGCVDTIRILTTWTSVMDDTLFFCNTNDAIILDDETTDRTPWDGAWSGAGVAQDDEGDWYFHPSVAGAGLHVLTYAANGCEDELVVVVHPSVLNVPLITVCGAEDVLMLVEMPPGATFSGPGIIDPATGLFDAAIAGAGLHTIQYDTPAGCSDVIEVEVLPFLTATIGGVQAEYCGNDLLVEVQLSPPGGVFSGLPQPQFNPSQLDPGSYTLVYSVGSGACTSSDTLTFVVQPALEATLSSSLTTICGGGSAQLLVEVSGGRPGMPYFIQWDNGLFPVEGHTVSPEEQTTYTVQVTDGCSDPIVLSVTIDVYPEFAPEFTFSEMQCYGEPGWVAGSVAQQGEYNFTWNTSPPQTTPVLDAPAGQSFTVVVENTASGCTRQQLVQVPSWPAVTALFSANPSLECIPFDQSEVTFIDLSNNAVGGEWNINGTVVPYVSGEYPIYDHGVAGQYGVSLTVYNEGGCTSEHALTVCVLSSTRVFVPDAFSPNGDGVNDMLFVRAPGVAEMLFQVHDRWGGLVFSTENVDLGWDGTTRQGMAPSGVYVYVLDAVMLDGETVRTTGDVTLVR
jgi:gliding motility-associated-like protein